MSINLISPTAYTTAMLIADTVVTPGGSSDSIPTMTQANDQTVDAAVEIQSTLGGFLPPRMTEDERNLLNATGGLMVYNNDTEQLNVFSGAAWFEIAGGAGGGNVSAAPGVYVIGDIPIFNSVDGHIIIDSGVSIVQVPAPAPFIARRRAAALTTVNQIGNLGHIQFVNDVGLIFVDSLMPVEFITNDFGPDSQTCSLFTGGLPSSSTTPSALVEIQSSTGALVISRMASVDQSALQKTPGMMLYNTDLSSYVLMQDTVSGIYIGGNGTAGDNLFVGYLAGPPTDVYDGINNTGFGTEVLSLLTTGSGNTAVGYGAGSLGETIDSCTFIGAFSNPSNDGITNSTAIGENSGVAVSNAVVLGNSCYVGIGNTSPAYTLDLGNVFSQCGIRLHNSTVEPTTPPSGSGVIYMSGEIPYFLDPEGNSTSLIQTLDIDFTYPPTFNNQLVNIDQGYSQGGFGGSALGSGNITMSAAGMAVFDTSTINANSVGFFGSAFDGRYLYMVPFVNSLGFFGQITRYDTTTSFTNGASYSFFDTSTVNANSKGFAGAVFDGHYIYFVPNFNGAYSGQITRYDTKLPLTSAGSYSFFDTAAVNANSKGFSGAIFDGRYIYLIPSVNGAFFGQITRYDTTLPFTSAGSYSFFNTTAVNSGSKGFHGAVFDGRYMYLVPYFNSGTSGQITRYDTTLSFTDPGSYSFFNTAMLSALSTGFYGSVFDGRYIYLVPYYNGVNIGQVTRYDTTLPFNLASSYSFFDTTTVNANSKGFVGAVFDGHYIYYIPYQTGVLYSGQVTRFDITQPFDSPGSYSFLDTAVIDANSQGFAGGMYDGKNVYLIPLQNGAGFSGQITRLNAYSGPQLSPFEPTQTVPTYNNQLVNVSQGYNQGSFGSSALGSGNITMSAAGMTVFDTSIYNANSGYFIGAAFDGRYLYCAPSAAPSMVGTITRYDTKSSFTSVSSYSFFDITSVNANSFGFYGTVFDGRYVYFVPYYTGVAFSGQITRYDTTMSFTNALSYSFFDTEVVNANSKAFFGAVFDGRYIYFIPFGTGLVISGQITRYDTTLSFTSAASYSFFDTGAVNVDSLGFNGGIFDGRYLYLVPFFNGVSYAGQITRYDTTLSFTSAGSYSFFDTKAINSNSDGFAGAVFDGRYIYFIPFVNGQVTQYDTTLPFDQGSSYAFFDTTTVDSNSYGFWGGVFDGRYIYFVPIFDSTNDGQVTRYDITQPFTDAASYSIFNTTAVNANSKGFAGGMYDGNYVYLIPSINGQITRLNAYSGPQLLPYQAPDTAPTVTSLQAPTYNNQLKNITQGYNQGGLGGSALGSGNIMMGNRDTKTFDLTTVDSNSHGFNGAVFDGRYMYLIPGRPASGQVTRYDTLLTFTDPSSYSVFDTKAVNTNSSGFTCGVFDGRYIYFVPNNNGVLSGQVTRYDTTLPFTKASSYSFFDMTTIFATLKGYQGAAFDGRYVYYVPFASGILTRYDTTLSFTDPGSYLEFDTTIFVNANSYGFIGAIFDGRYVYLVPCQNSTFFGQVTRYDTAQPFNAIGSYDVFDTATLTPTSVGFVGAVFDGRFIYYVQNNNGGGAGGQITQYDTAKSFTDPFSYSVFNTTTFNANSKGFFGGVFDGRFIYYVPNSNGQVTRYDIKKPFINSGSYTYFDTATVNVNSFGFFGGMYDGQYVYLIPASNGQITRLVAYSGPQLEPVGGI